MKKVYISVLLACFCINVSAQVSSSCSVPSLLAHEYEADIKNMALRQMYFLQSPDTAIVQIPQSWQDSVAEGLAAIFNAVSIPERDSVFNLYCVHDNTSPLVIYKSMLVQVDTNYSWTHSWENLIAITGNPYIDSIVTKYDLNVSQFFNWSFGNYALIQTDSLWNIYALLDSLKYESGVLSAKADAIIGLAGRISYSAIGSDRYYDFYFEFNDCFDGCDNYHVWHFRVNANCSVDYLGFDDWGVFGISPLPPPVNCNTFTKVPDNNNSIDNFSIFPNPAHSVINIMVNYSNSNNTYALLYDITGRVLIKTKIFFNSARIETGKLPSGIYSLRIIQNEQDFKVYKVIKE